MKKFALIGLLLFAPVAIAHQEDVPINTQEELRDWCQAESEALFVAKGITPYNWTASYWEEMNTFFVKGSWRIQDKDVVIECRVTRGAQRRYAVMVVHDAK